jgi:hypothetical protein
MDTKEHHKTLFLQGLEDVGYILANTNLCIIRHKAYNTYFYKKFIYNTNTKKFELVYYRTEHKNIEFDFIEMKIDTDLYISDNKKKNYEQILEDIKSFINKTKNTHLESSYFGMYKDTNKNISICVDIENNLLLTSKVKLYFTKYIYKRKYL